MKRLSLTVMAVFLSLFAAPGMAFECANVGAAATTAPDDNGDGEATACGPGTIAGGIASTALGINAFTGGDYSTALGYFASSIGYSSTALGDSALSVGDGSTALGFLAESSGVASTALGAWALSDQPYTIVLGSIAGVNYADTYTDVAIGTTAPLAPLHVHRDDGTAQILVEESNPVSGPQTLFKLANTGNTKFAIEEMGTGNTWAFTNNGYEFRVSLQGSGGPEFRLDNFGDAYLAGLLFENSDRNAKTNVRPIDRQAILEEVAALPIARWAYKKTPGTDHIGPMAQDFRAAFGTGAKDTTLATMDMSGVAIASIQALNEKLEQRTEEIECLQHENQSLRQELAELRASLREVAVLREQMQRLQTRIGLAAPEVQRIAVR